MENIPQSQYLPSWALSFRCYALGLLYYVIKVTASVLCRFRILTKADAAYLDSIYYIFLLQAIGFIILWLSVYPSRFGIAWRAYFLGCVLNVGLTLATYSVEYQSFGMYCVAMSVFHWSEYMTQAIFNPATTDVDSYMLYHSNSYVAAFVASMIEFWIEMSLIPDLKRIRFVTNVGLTLVMIGESLRKMSMWTAKSNFNHYVEHEKRDDHKLVTHGVYTFFRHPSYVGWFWWSIGTQIVLCNPFCTLAFALASWKFFSERIYFEEETLISFFGDEYIQYQQHVGTGLPFIKGFVRPTISRPQTSKEHSD